MASSGVSSGPYLRGKTYASLASLTGQSVASTGASVLNTEAPGQIVINFPCMPDVLELSRAANYASPHAMVMPDGFHIYQYTDPLEIPIKFSLSGHDQEYCNDDGPYALVAIAARLHALVMPITPSTPPGTTQNAPTATVTTSDQGTPTASTDDSQSTGGVSASVTDANALNGQIYFPPACLLAIMMATGLTGRPGLGINCTGFVKRVAVTFRGPWLQGSFDNNSGLRNLPSSADYEFTFVHQPGYTNNFANGGTRLIRTTTANDIFNRFYAEQFVTGSTAHTLYADLTGNTTVIPNGN